MDTAKQLVDSGHEICKGCDQEVDPETCWCGDDVKGHALVEHSFVPMGCICFRSQAQ